MPSGEIACSKFTNTSPSALCVGVSLTLNSTRIVGGTPTYSWVGFDKQSDGGCWYSLLINSAESTDPARWLSSTTQCTQVDSEGYPFGFVQTVAFSDFSTEPFAPGIFDLPDSCPK